MMNPVEFEAAKMRHQEFRLQAEQAAKQHQDELPEESTPLHAMVLAKLGEALVEIGETLQTRYGETTKQAYS